MSRDQDEESGDKINADDGSGQRRLLETGEVQGEFNPGQQAQKHLQNAYIFAAGFQVHAALRVSLSHV